MAVTSYNYPRFSRALFLDDLHLQGSPRPGDPAPELELPMAQGGIFRLSEYRGLKPVLFAYGSITCGLSAAALQVFKSLHAAFSPQIEFLTVYVRETHPGESYPHHASYGQKIRHAMDWVRREAIRWPVAVDTLEGDVHHLYGLLQTATYLIGRDGQVAFRAILAADEPLLRQALGEQLRREAEGQKLPVLGDRRDQMPAQDWSEFEHAVLRGGRIAEEDYRRELGSLGSAAHSLLTRLNPGQVQGELAKRR